MLHELRDRNSLAGLESDEEDEEMPAAEDDSLDKEAEHDGRNKRQKVTDELPDASGKGGMKDLFADSDDEDPVASQAAPGSAAKAPSRVRNAQLFGDSDDE